MKVSAEEYIVIDVETTGLSPDDDRIIEVAAVKCENDRIVDSFHSLINPGRRIPSNVTKLTGIKNADVAGAPDMDTVAPELSEFIRRWPRSLSRTVDSTIFSPKLLPVQSDGK